MMSQELCPHTRLRMFVAAVLPVFFILYGLSGNARARPDVPQLAARSHVLYELGSQQVLAAHNAHERIAPGALTKLMTAYVVFGALRDGTLSLQQQLTPTPYVLRLQSREPRMFLQADVAVTVDHLLNGLIVQSANDAARMLAGAVARHELVFADHMNATAERLGMRNTHFINASGVEEAGHYSSAHDMMLLAAALWQDFPDLMPRYAQRRYVYNGIEQYNPNRLLELDPRVDGMQAAHVDSLGYSLVASARRGQRRLIALVIGTATAAQRDSDGQRLINHGFREYEDLLLYRRQEAVQSLRVWKGTQDMLDIGFVADRHVTIPAGAQKRLAATLETLEPLVAPIHAGQQIGVLHLTLDGAPWLDTPVVALHGVPLANVFARGMDEIRLLFRSRSQ